MRTTLVFMMVMAFALVIWKPSLLTEARSRIGPALATVTSHLDEEALRDRLGELRTRLREKTMELLRRELHEMVDGLAR